MKKYALVGSLAFCCVVSLASAKTYASVDGEKITSEQLQTLLATTPNAPALKDLPKDILEKIVNQFVERELISKYAVKKGIKKDKEYKEKMAQLSKALATDMWIKKELDKTKVTDKEVKKFYNDNISKFKRPQQVRARHILLKDEKKAKDIIRQLKNTANQKKIEETFIELAKKNSTGPTKNNGGDLGYFARNKMVKPFGDVAFGMKVGTFTKKPVKTDFGYHVIYLVDKKPAKTVPFESIADNLKQAAKTHKFKDVLEKTLKKLKKKAKIKYYFDKKK